MGNARLNAENVRLSGELQKAYAEIDDLKAEIARLRAEIEALQRELADLRVAKELAEQLLRHFQSKPAPTPAPAPAPAPIVVQRPEEKTLDDIMASGFPPIYIDDLLPQNVGKAAQLQMKVSVFRFLDSKRESLKLTFRYYLSRSMYRTERVEFTISSNQMAKLLSDMNTSDAVGRSIGVITRTVKQIRLERSSGVSSGVMKAAQAFKGLSRQKSTERISDGGSGDTLNLREFVEAVVRIAVVQVNDEKRSLYDKVTRFFDKNFTAAHQFRLDSFRTDLFQTDPVQDVLKRHHAPMLQGFSKVSEGSNAVQLGEFFAFLRETQFFQHTKVTVAKAVQVYVISNFEEEVVDWEDWNFDMEFHQFQEAVVRLAVAEQADAKSARRLSVFSAESTKQASPESAAQAADELICKIFKAAQGDHFGTLRKEQKVHTSMADARANAIDDYIHERRALTPILSSPTAHDESYDSD